MTLKEAINVILDELEEHHYEDRGHDYSECRSCGWNTREDIPRGALGGGWGEPPYHRPGCKLSAALEVMRKEAA